MTSLPDNPVKGQAIMLKRENGFTLLEVVITFAIAHCFSGYCVLFYIGRRLNTAGTTLGKAQILRK